MKIKNILPIFAIALIMLFTIALNANAQTSVVSDVYEQTQPSVIDEVYDNTTPPASQDVTVKPTPPIGDGITVYVNYNPLTFDDVSPAIIEGRTLVPLRAIFEALGANVTWDNDTKTITATREETVVELTLNKTNASIDGNVVTLDVPAQLLNGRTMVPLRFVSESLGAEVKWDGTTKVITINLAS